MYVRPIRAYLTAVFVCVMVVASSAGPKGRTRGSKDSTARPERNTATRGTAAKAMAAVTATPIDIAGLQVQRFGNPSAVAGTPPGTRVYGQDGFLPSVYIPGAGQRTADDITLGSGPCGAVYYDLIVYSLGTNSTTFSVTTELWDGDPCEQGSSVIAGTEAEFLGVPSGQAMLLEATLDVPVTVPGNLWLAATFSTGDSGWLISEEAEVGFTGNFWSEDDASLGCTLLAFQNADPYGGFHANVYCDALADPPGACCGQDTCSEVTESECAASSGVWQNAYSTCDPDPCQVGTCCSGDNLATCEDTTYAGCGGGFEVFHPDAICENDPCLPAFKVFENDFATGQFRSMVLDTKWGDDIVLGPGAPCTLSAYNLSMTGDGGDPFDVYVELWTNDDVGTPLDERDDLPLAPITGTAMVFTDVPPDTTEHVLMAGAFDAIPLPDRVWMVFWTSSQLAGPVLGGMANVGNTRDAFAVFNDSSTPGVWADNFWYDGFNPEGCPGPAPCNPAGSFHINIWCEGDPPTGACCSDAAGTCIDGITLKQCDGRWAPGATCDSNPFVPQCGDSACCWLGNCAEMSPTECFGIGGDPSPGTFCSDVVCPRTACSDALGDCFASNGTAGCDDAFCCESVCDIDERCCTGVWDSACAAEAAELCGPALENDHCGQATEITGVGEVPFDNSEATTDGPPDRACGAVNGEQQIYNDVWYCWTAPWTDTTYLRTCGLTSVDTKIAVYQGCDACPMTADAAIACNDDFCGYPAQPEQSQVSFDVTVDQDYLIRIGTPQGEAGGSGYFNVSRGVPDNPACPGSDDCCAASGTPGCENEVCCNLVCACDPFCCEVTWDDNCAHLGVGESGCGAEELCASVCNEPCPDGLVSFVNPPNPVIDARQPHPPADALSLQGISTLTVEAPPGADNLSCWSLCDSTVERTTNEVADIFDNGDGTFLLTLSEPIAAGAVTTVTYNADGGASYTGTYTFHPANVDGSALADAGDLDNMINCCLNGQCNPPLSPEEIPYRCDIDRSGGISPADFLRLIDLLNGGDQLGVWLDTPLPTTGCP